MQSRRPDCVVLDLHMPHINGFEVQARLAGLVPPLPVIIATGHDSVEARERAIAAHPAAYLRKPLDEEVLLRAIEEAIANAPH